RRRFRRAGAKRGAVDVYLWRERRHDQRARDQGQERVQPRDEDPANDHGHSDQQDPHRAHGCGYNSGRVATTRKTPEQLRSYRWLGPDDLRTSGHRSRLKQMGFSRGDWEGKPVIAILNTW